MQDQRCSLAFILNSSIQHNREKEREEESRRVEEMEREDEDKQEQFLDGDYACQPGSSNTLRFETVVTPPPLQKEPRRSAFVPYADLLCRRLPKPILPAPQSLTATTPTIIPFNINQKKRKAVTQEENQHPNHKLTTSKERRLEDQAPSKDDIVSHIRMLRERALLGISDASTTTPSSPLLPQSPPGFSTSTYPVPEVVVSNTRRNKALVQQLLDEALPVDDVHNNTHNENHLDHNNEKRTRATREQVASPQLQLIFVSYFKLIILFWCLLKDCIYGQDLCIGCYAFDRDSNADRQDIGHVAQEGADLVPE